MAFFSSRVELRLKFAGTARWGSVEREEVGMVGGESNVGFSRCLCQEII